MPIVSKDDFDSLKIQFYVVSGVLGFLIIVLIAVVINLSIKIYARRDIDDEDEEVSRPEMKQRPPPPAANSAFALPKANLNKSFRDRDAEIRRQNNEHENRIPQPALSKSWNAYPGDRNTGRNHSRPQFEDDNLSNCSYDGRRSPLSPVSKSSGSAFRNPLSGSTNNELESRFDFSKNRTDKPKPPAFKPGGAPNSYLHGGNFNYGFNRNFERERDNNYY